MNYYTQILALCAINGLLALAAYLPLASGAIVVCLGTAMSLGGIAGGLAAEMHRGFASEFIALAAGMATGAVFMAVTALLAWRMSGFVLALTTLGVAELTRVIAQNQDMLGGALGFRIDSPHPSVWSPLVVLTAGIVIVAHIERTPLRSAMFFCRDNPNAAPALGVDPARIRFMTMVGGGSLAGAAGVLLIQNVGILDPRLFGFESGIQILLFAIAGGTTTWVGPVMAGVTLTVIPEALRFSTSHRMLLYGAVLVAIVVLRPEGLWQRKQPARIMPALE